MDEVVDFFLRYVDANVRQVMNYLDAYRNRGGRVPEKTYAALRERCTHSEIQNNQSNSESTIIISIILLLISKKYR